MLGIIKQILTVKNRQCKKFLKVLENWMRNKNIVSFLGLGEQMHNPNFKGIEFENFENEAYQNKIEWHANRILSKVN